MFIYLYGNLHYFNGSHVQMLIKRYRYTAYLLWPCSLAVPVLAGWVYAFVVLCQGTTEGSISSGSGFKASQKMGQRLKVSSDRLGEAIEPATPGLKDIGVFFSHLHILFAISYNHIYIYTHSY